MVNKDYILRIAERVGRELAIILGLRKANKQENALIYVDDLFLNTVGLTSSFINSLSDEALLQILSPLGTLNVDKCLWVAALLKAEGDVYADLHNDNESYYRYLKALNLFLTVQLSEGHKTAAFFVETDELIQRLADYDLPDNSKEKLFSYYELSGHYAKAEDILFELLDSSNATTPSLVRGRAFYERLARKTDADLAAGNLSRDELAEGLNELKNLQALLDK